MNNIPDESDVRCIAPQALDWWRSLQQRPGGMSRHNCQDETATVVDGKWLCKCPGSPYRIATEEQEVEA